MRWKIVTAGLMVMGLISAGCQQRCFMTAEDFSHYQDMGLASLESVSSTCAPLPPTIKDMPPLPATVNDPEREIRYLTLAEAVATSLEKGTVGIQSAAAPGTINDGLVQFTGRGVAGSDSIRVLALQPAIVASDIEASLAKFDARWVNNLQWTKSEQPVGSFLQTLQAGGRNVIVTDGAQISTAVIKPLPTGGVGGITFNNNYQLTNTPARVNPSVQPTLTFSFEQPLLQGYGVEINQLRSTHPGSVLNPFPTGGRVEGILIARLRFDEQRAEFERNLNFQLLNVEIAYWNLYGSYWTLYSREQALRQAYETWKIQKAKFEAGQRPIQDLAQSRQQYEQFRGQRLTALGDVLEKERQLRGLMGLPIEDGTRLVPIDVPTLSPYHPDWYAAVHEALNLRPELVLTRHDVKARQLELINQKNLLLPDLRFVSKYELTGLGTRLDGNDVNANAYRNLATGDFTNWTLGLQMNMPFGFRDANAAVRTARLNLAQSFAVLQDQETKAVRALEFQYRRIFEAYEQILAQRANREAAAIQLEARFKNFLAGRETLDILLEAQRTWADALKAEYDNIVLYNNALVAFEFSKGTIQQRSNVVVAEGPLPSCALVRAVEHERERSKALVLRERSIPVKHVPCGCENGGCGLPAPSTPTAPALPSLTDLPEMLKNKPALPAVEAAGSSKVSLMPPAVGAAEPQTTPPQAQFDKAAIGSSLAPDKMTLPPPPEWEEPKSPLPAKKK